VTGTTLARSVALLATTSAMLAAQETTGASLRARDRIVADSLRADSAARPRRFGWWPAEAGTWYNTTRASPVSEGPVWLGRGLTAAVSAGGATRLGPVTVAVRPLAYWSENRDYRLFADVALINPDFESEWLAGQIDLPRRFGASGYGRADAGESFVRVDVSRLGAGFSNAAQTWGPALLQPLALSDQAGGFPHAFIDAARVPVGVGHVDLRWIAGQLQSSGYGPLHPGTKTRALIGAVGVFAPRSLEWLQVGGLRLFHLYDSSIAYDAESLLLPFQAFLKDKVKSTSDPRRETNQLASFFARLAPPQSPLELYAEYMRDDHNADTRDLVVEPDHDAAYTIGLQWTSPRPVTPTVVTVEAVNARMTHLDRVREQAPPYVHSRIIEGHTERGLVLGSWMATGGGGMQVRVERGGTLGDPEWTFDAWVARLAQDEEGGTFQGEPTGEFGFGAKRTIATKRGRWQPGILIEPGFGHIHSWNFQFRVSAAARTN